MSNSDHDLPITESFSSIVDRTKQADLEGEERRLLAEREARMRLFAAHNPGKLTANQAFLPDEREGEKLKASIDRELNAQEAARKAAQEKADGAPSGEFPPPSFTT